MQLVEFGGTVTQGPLNFVLASGTTRDANGASHPILTVRGRIVEIVPRAPMFDNPMDAHTRSLLCAVPIADPGKRHFADELNFNSVRSPMLPPGHQLAPSTATEVAPGHVVLQA